MSGSLWIMRHGALPPNPERRFVGQRDIPLAALGRRQALSWRQRLMDISFAAIVSSDLARCTETALLVRGERDIPLIRESAFREISLGAWEGLTPDEVEKYFPGEYAERGKNLAHFRPQGGESFADAAQRVLPALNAWTRRSAGRPLLVVAHAGVNRVVAAHYMALTLQTLLRIPQPYACCMRLCVDDCAVRQADDRIA